MGYGTASIIRPTAGKNFMEKQPIVQSEKYATNGYSHLKPLPVGEHGEECRLGRHDSPLVMCRTHTPRAQQASNLDSIEFSWSSLRICARLHDRQPRLGAKHKNRSPSRVRYPEIRANMSSATILASRDIGVGLVPDDLTALADKFRSAGAH